mmetsp:Transcript_17278/g.28052  ORF Transcript_17278/g.28052 Transcript_17278/m.28052 type:complete len:94 (-) Transcript_17278:454-735(-)
MAPWGRPTPIISYLANVLHHVARRGDVDEASHHVLILFWKAFLKIGFHQWWCSHGVKASAEKWYLEILDRRVEIWSAHLDDIFNGRIETLMEE